MTVAERFREGWPAVAVLGADSGCMQGEVHLCGYHRFLLPEAIKVKQQPC